MAAPAEPAPSGPNGPTVRAPWAHRLGGAPRTVPQMREALLLAEGDVRTKACRFWLLLVLSAVIATAGVLADSTATVIGAMIIAPLATPIMGTALGVVAADRRAWATSAATVALGAAVVVGVGALIAWLAPGAVDTVANSQVAGRTSPRLVDLLAAVATGFAGAFALSRSDVSDVLPGVAIAISLVPPLAVVGIVAAQGDWTAAAGAFLLFASNAVSLVTVGMLVFALFGFRAPGVSLAARGRQLVLAVVGLGLIGVPLLANTVLVLVVEQLVVLTEDAATDWAATQPGERVRDVGADLTPPGVVISLEGPGRLPDLDGLLDELSQVLPAGMEVRVDRVQGQEVMVGTTTSG